MKVFIQDDMHLYGKKGFNTNIASYGASVNMTEIYDYLKRTQKKPGDLTRQEYMMFRK